MRREGEESFWPLVIASVVAAILMVFIAWLVVGCGGVPYTTQAVGVVSVVEVRPDSIWYRSVNGNWCLVWGHGPVNVACNLRAYMKAHPVGQLADHYEAGAVFAGAFDHTPVPGDTLRGTLLFTGPLVDSLHATSGGYALTCVLPDSLEGRAWAIVPAGPYGPDSVVAFLSLKRNP